MGREVEAMAGDEEEITVDLSLRDYLSASAEKAARAAEDLKDQVKQLNRQLLMLDKRADKATASLIKLEAAMRAFTGTNKDVNASFEKINDSVTKYTKNNDSLIKSHKKVDNSSKNVIRTLQKLTRGFKLLTIAATASKMALMAVGMALAGALAGSLIGLAIQNVIVLGAQLASLAAYAALVPTAIGAMVLSLVTLKVAFKGVGDGIKAAMSGDLEKMNEAIKDLQKPAKMFVQEIYKFAPAFKRIRQMTQAFLFAPLNEEVKPLLKELVPIFEKEMPQLAYKFGLFFRSVMKFFQTDAGGGIFVDLFDAAQKFIGSLTGAMPELLQGLADVIHVVSDNWDTMSDRFGSMAERFGKWMSRISEDGTLDKWLDTAGTVLKLLGNIAGSIIDIFANIAKATGGNPLGGLSEILEGFAEWTGSEQGQAAIHDFFQALATVLSALMPVILALANAFATTLAPAIAQIAVAVGPLLEELVPIVVDLIDQLAGPLISVAKALAPVIATLGKGIGVLIKPLETIITTLAPYVDEFLQALAESLDTLAPMWGPLAKAVGEVLVALTPLLPVLAELIKLLGLELAEIFTVLAPILKVFLEVALAPLLILFQSMAQILEANMPFIQRLMQTFSEAFERLAPVIADIAEQFSVFIGQVIERLIPLWEREIPLFERFIELWADEFFAAIEQLMPMLPELFDALLAIMDALLQPEVVDAILAIVGAMLELSLALIPLIPLVIAAAEYFIGLGLAGLRVVGMIIEFVNKTRAKVQEIIDFLERMFGVSLQDIITHPFQAAAQIITNIWDGIKSTIGSAVDAVKSKISEAGSFLNSLNPFRAFGGPVEAGQKYTVGEIGPEMYVPKVGSTQMIGVGGQEDRSFSGDGMIIPSYMLDMFDRVGAGIEKSLAKSAPSVGGGIPADEVAELVKIASENSSTTYNATVNVYGGSDMTPDDIERAVVDAMKKVEKDRRERS